jgi:hypothetical protein
MQNFESKKKDFGGPALSNKRPIKLGLKLPADWVPADVTGYDYDYGITITVDDMRRCFDPIISNIISLLEHQVEAVRKEGRTRIERVILVGGLGDSKYLRDRLKDWSQNRGIDDIRTTFEGG